MKWSRQQNFEKYIFLKFGKILIMKKKSCHVNDVMWHHMIWDVFWMMSWDLKGDIIGVVMFFIMGFFWNSSLSHIYVGMIFVPLGF